MSEILVIDDNLSLCKLLANVASKMGYNTVSRHTLADGKKEVLDNPYDVVFLDVNLPDGNGLEMLPMIRNLPSAPEVIIITGYGNEESAEIAIKNGAWDYIQKTDSPSKIMLPLKRIIQYKSELKGKVPIVLETDGIIGRSPEMKSSLESLAMAAGSSVNILFTGETGTGKELFAKALHRNSQQAQQNFIVVDCSAIPENLVASILFGYRKGAYTGAEHSQEGLILQADKGTLFLDEVGELPLEMQKVFLRVLQERSIRPIGSKNELKSNFRLISATNQDLDQMVDSGKFRKDLLYRLRTMVIHLPPLRTHPDDIAEIALYHLKRFCSQFGVSMKGFSPDILDAMQSYSWEGNVRELVKAVEHAVINAGSAGVLFPKHLPEYIRIKIAKKSVREDSARKIPFQNSSPGKSILEPLKQIRKNAADRAEKEYLKELLSLIGTDIDAACRISGLSRSRYYELLNKHGLTVSPNTR